MKTTTDLRPFFGKAILGMTLASFAAFSSGCSDGATSTPSATRCIAAPLSVTDAPALQVSLHANPHSTPNVTLHGAGFPPGARVSLAYVGMPGRVAGGETKNFDFDDVAIVTDEGTFNVTQHYVYELEPCDSSSPTTASVVVGADGLLAGAELPTSFWCEGNTEANWANICE